MSAARLPCQKVLDYGCLVCTISALTRPVESAFSAAALSGFGCAFASCSGCETSTLTFSGVWGDDALIWSNNHWLSNWAEAPMDVIAATATTTEGKNLDFMMRSFQTGPALTTLTARLKPPFAMDAVQLKAGIWNFPLKWAVDFVAALRVQSLCLWRCANVLTVC